METFVSYIGWTIVAAAVAAYFGVFFRYVLFPKMPTPHAHDTRRAA